MPRGIYKRNPGRIVPLETRRKISEGMKGHKNTLGYRHSEETKRKIGEKSRGRHLSEEAKRKIGLANSVALKGNIPWSKGKKFSEEHRKKLSESKKKNPTKYWLGKKRPDMTGENSPCWKGGWRNNLPKCMDCGNATSSSKNNKRCRKCFDKYGVGGKSSAWKGGLTPVATLIRMCFKYRQWRSDIFTRDDYTCILCGNRGVYLEADHYPKMFSEIFQQYKIKSLEEALACEEFWNINNGRTLCKKCHCKFGL